LQKIKEARHFISNFHDEITFKYNRNVNLLGDEEFEQLSKIFCDGLSITHPSVNNEEL